MAPKQQFRRDIFPGEVSFHPAEKGKSIMCWTRQTTQEEDKHFKEHVPLGIRKEAERVVEELWVKYQKIIGPSNKA